MASLVDEIVGVLIEEEKMYSALLDCAERKTQILIKADIPALEKLTAEEQVKSDQLLSLGNKQIQLLNDIKMVLGRKEEKLTVTNLIGYLGSQPQVQEKLTTARNNLLDVATKVQQKNQENEMLLKRAIELVEFDITLFKYSVLFIGIDLSLLAIIIINILILLVMLNYIINKRSNLKLISCIFLGSLILCGVGVGVSLIGFSSFKFEDSMDGISKDIEKEITISYVDDMVIQTSFDESYKIIIDNSMSNDFIKVVGTNKELYFDKINYSVDKYHGMRSYSFHNSGSLNFSDLINLVYSDLENKTFREYYLTNGDISIVCNSHIANKLINNAKKIYLVDYNKTSYGYEVFDYNQKIFLDYNCEMEYNAADDSYSCDDECVCEKKVSNTSLGDVIDFNCKYK